MNKAKPYKKQEAIAECVAEPAAVEYSTVAENVDFLADDILVGAIKYTQIAREKGRMIPNKDVYGLLSERLGWK